MVKQALSDGRPGVKKYFKGDDEYRWLRAKLSKIQSEQNLMSEIKQKMKMRRNQTAEKLPTIQNHTIGALEGSASKFDRFLDERLKEVGSASKYSEFLKTH